jgi:hypothetical protein
MLWQCTTCSIKYLGRPTGASLAYNSHLAEAPLFITVCNKGLQLNYAFPELAAVDVRPGPGADWRTIWAADTASSPTVVETFLTVSNKNRLQVCKTLMLYESRLYEIRMRHYYSQQCENMKVYLHTRGLFHATDFSLPLDKELFASDESFVLELAMEILDFLPSAEFNCSQAYDGAWTLDSCLLAEATRVASQSAGCVSSLLG